MNIQGSVDLSKLNKRDDHNLPDKARLMVLWESVFGITVNGEVKKAGLFHLLEGWKVRMRDKDGKPEKNQLEFPGLRVKMANMEFEFERIKDHLVALTRMLCETCKIGTREFVEELLEKHLNQSFLNSIGHELAILGEEEEKKRIELEKQLKNKDVSASDSASNSGKPPIIPTDDPTKI